MPSRYTQEYFLRHTLMNVSFTDLNEIIYPLVEDIPEYIRHYTSAMFVNSSFQDDMNKVQDNLAMEGHSEDYIRSYMSYIQMNQTTYRLITKGKFLSANYVKQLQLQFYTLSTYLQFL